MQINVFIKVLIFKFEQKLGPPFSILQTTHLFARLSCLN